MKVRSLGFRTDLMVRRLAGSELEDLGDHLVVRSPGLPDFYWGNFLLLGGGAAIEDAPRWLGEFRRHFPEARHLALGWDGGGRGARSRLRSLVAAGLRLEVATVLRADRPPGPRASPAEASVRALREPFDWEQLFELSTAANGPEMESPPQQRFLRTRVAETARLSASGRAATLGAFLGARLAASSGIVAGGRGTARFQDVQTHPDFRRRGLAGAVVSAAGQLAWDALGARRLVIVADPEGPALRLYRALGFREVESQVSLERAPG